MAQSYTRQSSFADGDTITAALFNNEYNQLVNAFSYSSTNEATTGHRHNGSAGEGGNIPQIGDLDFLNKIVVDSTNNRWGFYVQVASSTVEQLRLQDGALIPVTDSDVDLGTSSLYFKDAYIDSITTTGNVAVGGNLTVTGTTTFNGGTITMGDAATDNVVFGADVDSNIIPDDDDSYDLGSASQQWKDIYIDGVAYVDAINFNGTAITSTAAELNILDGVTSTAAELNILDGVTSTTAEINLLDGVTSTTAELNILDGVTATSTEINILDGVTSTTAELNILDGVTATAAEINALDGITSTVAELNILDGVTSTAAELNLLDGKAFLDEDNLVSNSATGIASQQSIKAYVDAQVTAQDLDIITDSGTIAIDLDSENLTVSGGTGLDSSATGNAVTLAIDSTVTTLTGSQTLTNKTLTTPVISSISNTGTLTLPTSTDTLVGRATTDTLTNKTLTSPDVNTPDIDGGTIDGATIATSDVTVGAGKTLDVSAGTLTLADNQISGDKVEGGTIAATTITDLTFGSLNDGTITATAFVDEDNMASNSATLIPTQQSVKAYVDTTVAATNEVVEDTTPQLGGDLASNGNDILFADSDKAIFGAGSDLSIYHDGSNSYIHETGTGSLNILGQGRITLKNSAGDETLADFLTNNRVDLYYDNAIKFTTTSTGIDVTGTATMDGLTVDGNVLATGSSLTIQPASATNTAILNIKSNSSASGGYDRPVIQMRDAATTGGFNIKLNGDDGNSLTLEQLVSNVAIKRFKASSGGDISFYNTAGTSQALFWDASAESLGIGTTSPASKLELETTEATVFDGTATDGQAGNGSTLAIQNLSDTNNTFSQILFRNRSTSKAVSRIASLTDSTGTEMAFVVENNGSPNEVLRIDKTGSVGIGTSSPSSELHVIGETRVEQTGAASRLVINRYDVNAADSSTIDLLESSSQGASFGTTGVFGYRLELDGNTNNLNIKSGNQSTVNTRLSIERDTGNVGIGTDSPSYKLGFGDSVGTERFSIDVGTIEAEAIHVATANRHLTFDASGPGSRYISFKTGSTAYSGTEKVRISSSGNVGIGTTSPNYLLDVNEIGRNSTGEVLLTAGNASSNDYTQSTLLRLRATSINPNAPAHNLDSAVAEIRFNHTDLAGNASRGDIIFYTNPGNNTSDPLERMSILGNGSVTVNDTGLDVDFRVESSGNTHMLFVDGGNDRVGIGTDSPSDELTIRGAQFATTTLSIGDNSDRFRIGYLHASGLSSGLAAAQLGSDAYSDLSIAAPSNGASEIKFFTNASSGTPQQRATIDSSGNFLVGKTSADNGATVGLEYTAADKLYVTDSASSAIVMNRLASDGNIAVFQKDGTTVGSIGVKGGDLTIGTGVVGLRFHDGTSSIRPITTVDGTVTDDTVDLGTTVARFDDIYATNATIQTSDRNEKQDIEALTDAETRVAVAAKGLLRKFKWKSAVASKGDNARIHFGIIAQDLQDAFTAEGLDAGDYAMFISNTWTDNDGVEQTRLGVRYSELLAFIIAAI